MTHEHASGEQLALLAMEAEVPDAVRVHVASCPECLFNLSIVRSLLAADGIEQLTESEFQHEADDTRLLAEFTTAMADSADGWGNPEQHAEADDGNAAPSTAPGEARAVESGPTYNPLVASVVIAVAAAIVILGIMVWR